MCVKRVKECERACLKKWDRVCSMVYCQRAYHKEYQRVCDRYDGVCAPLQ